jgi:ATP-binding cassette, subfamily G (WHITE), member 1
LKKLALEGKIVICTIHTPSALIFEMIDYVYGMAEGNCIYQGSSQNLVTFLKELDLNCPLTFNPADFLLEIANNDYGKLNSQLTDKIANGTNVTFRKEWMFVNNNNNESSLKRTSNDVTLNLERSSFFFHKLVLLMQRNFIISMRNKSFLIQRLLVSLTVGLLIGGLYINIGEEASHIYANFKFIFASVFFLLYISYYSQQTSCK